jgi:hypothetical protein
MHESLDLETVLNTAAYDIGESLGLAALDVRLGPVSAPHAREDGLPGNGAGQPAASGPEEKE